MRIAISQEDCTDDELRAYIDLGIREGWSDPVGFAHNRVREKRQVRRHKLSAGQCPYCDRERDNAFHPPHDASDRCESGKHNHCTCSTCF